MGDNRDNSNDSRVWGFADDSLIVGRAFAVWMHWVFRRYRSPMGGLSGEYHQP